MFVYVDNRVKFPFPPFQTRIGMNEMNGRREKGLQAGVTGEGVDQETVIAEGALGIKTGGEGNKINELCNLLHNLEMHERFIFSGQILTAY